MKSDYLSVAIDGGKSYQISFGQSLISNLYDFLPFSLAGLNVYVVTDENVVRPYAEKVKTACKDGGASEVYTLTLQAGEQTKSYDSLQTVLSWMLDHGINRQSVVIALGGGVIGDLTGFAASIVLRGVKYIQIPTTLLAQVDSSVGGKTAIDVPQGKNLVGTFYQPEHVICDLDVLKTLSERQMRAGYAEIVKYAFIRDVQFYHWLKDNHQSVLQKKKESLHHAVFLSCKHKAEIVAEDEKESGVRALLNLGHTFAHVLETAVEYDERLIHGEAVAIGMALAFDLSAEMRLCSEEDRQDVRKHLKTADLPTDIHQIPDFPPTIKPEDLLEMMYRDKKVYKGRLTFILAQGIGQAFISRDVEHDPVLRVLKRSMAKG